MPAKKKAAQAPAPAAKRAKGDKGEAKAQDFDAVFVGLEDTLVSFEQSGKETVTVINYGLVRFLYQCVSRGKKIVCVTRTPLCPYGVLRRTKLLGLMDEVIALPLKVVEGSKDPQQFSDVVTNTGIFIDASQTEREAVAKSNKVPVYTADEAASLFDESDTGSTIVQPKDSGKRAPPPYALGKESISDDFGDFEWRDCEKKRNETGVTPGIYDKETFIRGRQHIAIFLKNSVEKYVNSHKGKGHLLEVSPQDHAGAKPWITNKSVTHQALGLEPAHNVDIVGDITVENKSLAAGSFDFVVCCDVIEHCFTPWSSITEMHRLLKKGGLMFLSVPCNFRIHGPLPDGWRFTEHGLRHLVRKGEAKEFGETDLFELLELRAVDVPNRPLFPLHYTVVARKN